MMTMKFLVVDCCYHVVVSSSFHNVSSIWSLIYTYYLDRILLLHLRMPRVGMFFSQGLRYYDDDVVECVLQ